jgi:hypothetical protein
MIDPRFKDKVNIQWFDKSYFFKIGNKEKIDLGCGNFKYSTDFVGVDKRKTECTDIVCDLESFPWPFKDNSCSILIAHRILESIKPWFTIDFMNECWRVLEYGGLFATITPYAGSRYSYVDPNACSYWNEFTLFCFVPGNDFYPIYTPKPWEREYMDFHKESDIKFAIRKTHLKL